MKLKFLALAFAAAATLGPIAARADDDDVSVDSFYDNLSPYGEWVEVGDYGNCWHPTGVDAEWAPYTDGYWSYTDAGWTWVSYEDFGDICYHYGRWVDTDEIGWCWVPDTEWGPAWVSWRQDDEYIGWAPLPPEATWQPSVGVSVWVDDYCDIGPSYYNFCPVVEFGAPVIRHVCIPRVNVISIFARTVNITNICWNGYRNVVFCGGPNYTVINTRLRRPIPTFKLVQNNTIINNNVTIINNRRVVKFPRNHVAGNTLNVFSPKVVKKNVTNFKPQITKVVQKDKVNRGWKMQDQGQAAKMREKVKSEAKGLNPDTAPAKPVQVADLKPVPEKANPKGPSPVADRDRGNKGDKPDRGVADRPGKGPDGNDKPDQPGKVAGDRPGRQGGDGNDKPGKVTADGTGQDEDNKPGGNRGNPLVKPFNEGKQDGQPGRGAGNGQGMGKRQGGADGGGDNGQAERQRQAAEQAERQQRQAEARQRQLEAQRGQGQEAERRQRPPEPQRGLPDRQPQVDRQEQLQRQAEMQQRQLQAQRQQQILELRRQQQQQRAQQPPQQGGGGGGKQAPVQQGQGQGQGQGGARKQLTPEEREALRKQRGF